MVTYVPVSTIGDGQGLNITVHSYLDELEFGLISCRELVPDLWHMIDLHIDEIGVLFAAAGLDRAAPAKKASAQKTGGRKRASAKKRSPAPKKAAAKKRAPATEKAAGRKRAPATKAAGRKRAPATKAVAKKRAPAKKRAAATRSA